MDVEPESGAKKPRDEAEPALWMELGMDPGAGGVSPAVDATGPADDGGEGLLVVFDRDDPEDGTTPRTDVMPKIEAALAAERRAAAGGGLNLADLVIWGDPGLVEQALSAPAAAKEVLATDRCGRTAASAAERFAGRQVKQMVVEWAKKAEPAPPPEVTRVELPPTPLQVAVERGDLEMVKLLLAAGADPNRG